MGRYIKTECAALPFGERSASFSTIRGCSWQLAAAAGSLRIDIYKGQNEISGQCLNASVVSSRSNVCLSL